MRTDNFYLKKIDFLSKMAYNNYATFIFEIIGGYTKT